MEFDQLKNIWQGQSADSDLFNHEKIKEMVSIIDKKRKETIYANVGISTGLLPVIIMTISFAFIFDDRTPYFYWSLGLMAVLLITMICISWSRSINWGPGALTADNQEYIDATIKKLKFGKTMTGVVFPVYIVLLTTIFNFYFIDMFQDVLALNIRILIHAVFSIFMLLAMFIIVKKTLVVHQKEVQPIIDDLKKMKEST